MSNERARGPIFELFEKCRKRQFNGPKELEIVNFEREVVRPPTAYIRWSDPGIHMLEDGDDLKGKLRSALTLVIVSSSEKRGNCHKQRPSTITVRSSISDMEMEAG